MAERKPSASATGGRMLNPSVEPKARRESAQARRNSTGKARRDSTSRTSVDAHKPERQGSTTFSQHEVDSSAAALEARRQRRSIGLKRISVTDHVKDALIHALENVARGMGSGAEAQGIQKLQDIMTNAKEKGFGVSKLFQFFLIQSEAATKRVSDGGDGQSRGSTDRVPRGLKDVAQVADSAGNDETPGQSVFKDTLASKTRAEASRSSRNLKKSSLDLMPSLQKGDRPGTADSRTGSARGRPGTSRGSKEDASVRRDGGSGVPPIPASHRSSLSRRSSVAEEAAMRDRQISVASFQRGLATLGFKLTTDEAASMFRHVDANGDDNIDLMEFTRFCLEVRYFIERTLEWLHEVARRSDPQQLIESWALIDKPRSRMTDIETDFVDHEIPSMAWKAERARRGILTANPADAAGVELERAAWDIAHETIAAGEAEQTADGGGLSAAAAEEERKKPRVNLGRVVFRGEKFFWRSKDLIEVVIQLNAKEGFMAVSTFHTEKLIVYPLIFIDPSKIPINEATVNERAKDMADKEMAAQKEELMSNTTTGDGDNHEVIHQKVTSEPEVLAQKAHLAFIADYILHRISMPDQNGNLLQPDLTQPDAQVNPDLPGQGLETGNVSQGEQGVASASEGGTSTRARPGLMKTTFDKWDTLLFPNPPSRVEGAPKFAKQKKRESYFMEFQSKKGEFDENRVKAHRFSAEAAAYTEEVSMLMKKLAPLNHSASAPTVLHSDQNASTNAANPATAGVDLNTRRASSRIVLTDDISEGLSPRRASSKRKSFLESQSEPVLPTVDQVGA